MFQEAVLGLYDTLEKFDLSKNCKFSTYANCWMNARVRRFIKYENGNVRVPKCDNNYSKISRNRNIFYNEFGYLPSPLELAEKLNFTLRNVKHVLKKMDSKTFSLNSKFKSEKDKRNSYLEQMSEDDKFSLNQKVSSLDGIKKYEDNEFFENVWEKILKWIKREHVPLKDSAAFFMREGVFGKNCTLEEVGKTLGVTRERVRQRVAKLIEIMKEYPDDLKKCWEVYSESKH